jgi:hypothetical protein
MALTIARAFSKTAPEPHPTRAAEATAKNGFQQRKLTPKVATFSATSAKMPATFARGLSELHRKSSTAKTGSPTAKNAVSVTTVQKF